MMDALALLVAKDEIRELAQLYARGIDRKDVGLLRTLYTVDAIDNHGTYYSGPVEGYFTFLERSLPHMHIGSHNICNHLISVDGDRAEGEVYAIAWHLVPDGQGGLAHDIQGVRYVDNYRREGGRWLFAQRDVTFDMKLLLPAAEHGDQPDPTRDVTYSVLHSALFARH
jgi:hypothetical protein